MKRKARLCGRKVLGEINSFHRGGDNQREGDESRGSRDKTRLSVREVEGDVLCG